MEPPPDPPPPAAEIPAPPVVPAAAPIPTHPPGHNHPPYAEMITAAISTLNERGGSSKRAIAKYVEAHYSNLPSTHSALLDHHLKRLKANGQVVMVKHSYKLPKSAPSVKVNDTAVNGVSSPDGPKRRPGRPPKPKPEAPVISAPVNMNAVPVVSGVEPLQNTATGQGAVYNSVGPVNGPSPSVAKRGRGRPPKQGGSGRPPKQGGPGRPPKSGLPHIGGTGRRPGRPKKNVVQVKSPGRPRGRPPKPINVAGGVGSTPAVGAGMAVVPPAVEVAILGTVVRKRRGRPPKAGGEVKKPKKLTDHLKPRRPRKLSGKPLGRPKKNASAAAPQHPSSQLLSAYIDLRRKFENLQSRIKQTSSVVKPCLNSEAAVNALEELETLASMDFNAQSDVQNQQPQPQPQPQPQQEPQPLS